LNKAALGNYKTAVNTVAPSTKAKKKAAGRRAFLKIDPDGRRQIRPTRSDGPLLQRRVDRVDLGIQVAAKAVDRNNDRNRNTRCDQAVFNGSCFVGEKPVGNFGRGAQRF
jgi:hypothetical protein